MDEQKPQNANEGTMGPSRSTAGLGRILNMARAAFRSRRPADAWFKDATPNFAEFARLIAKEEREATLDNVLAGLHSEDDSTQLRAIISSVEAMRSNVKCVRQMAC